MSQEQPVNFVATAATEERARANLYAVLASLLYRGPSAELLADIAGADDLVEPAGTPLAQAWSALQGACRVTTSRAARQEYDDIFVGVGQAPVSIYASHYLSENWKDHTLVSLRGELARLSLARQPDAVEPEDHLAGLLDVMRHLILRAGADDVALQEGFFRSYLAPVYKPFWIALGTAKSLGFYRHVGLLLTSFLEIEVECFQIA